MADYDDPAQRLLALLQEARKFDDNPSAYEAWCRLFRIRPDDEAGFYHHLGRVYALPLLIRKKIEHIRDIRSEAYLYWIPMLSEALRGCRLEGNWNDFLKRISDAVLAGLEICSDTLRRNCPERTLSNDQLEVLLRDVRGLVDEVVASDIAETLKQYMLKHLDMVERAIQDHRLHGTEPLENAVAAVVGSVFLREGIQQEIANTDVGNRFWTLMGRVLMIVGITAGTAQITRDVLNLLPGEEEAAEVEPQGANSDGTPGVDIELHADAEASHGSGAGPGTAAR